MGQETASESFLNHAQELQETNSKLRRANEELARPYEKTKEIDELKTQFFANISHELRTPLALIVGPTEKLLASETLSGTAHHDLEVVARNARTLLRHVNDLLDVSKVDAGKMQVRYSETDLARLIRLVASHFDVIAHEKKIAYKIETPESTPAQLDADKIHRVMLNLLSNAFKFTPSGGKVRCTLRSDGSRALVEVADSGPGIPPDQRDVVFERFHQLDGGANRRFGGTGLGLAIAHDFVKLLEGTITVTEAPEGGALFSVIMPLHAPAGVDLCTGRDMIAETQDAPRHAVKELSPPSVGVPAEAAHRRARPLVLVIEDNPETNRFICDTLVRDYQTKSAFDGKGGLQNALESRPDLIVTDIMMPGMSGNEFLRAARARRELNAVPIVLLTAKTDDDVRVSLLRDGAQDYLMNHSLRRNCSSAWETRSR